MNSRTAHGRKSNTGMTYVNIYILKLKMRYDRKNNNDVLQCTETTNYLAPKIWTEMENF